ncbi:putative chlorophyll A-B binding protein [Helianthus annuus]|uniref:Chlorophyll A-B binding protein n=1 Tax=Helianthus annuus TaxID=4232 RepID=A0A251VB68_HELAN|nr:early light-induced protein 2, chloroplastic [Helianthus annuus]KAF5815759.1 putative chlorophyll A-B binding protein [Helianthus annuus]KAJ0945018.1 putative chlorophyll A-B binding protein [Helianthus annuus]
MAATSVFMATPVARLTTQHLRKNINFSVVRCISQDQQSSTDSSKTPAAPTPPPKNKFSDVLAFSGPAPERINGRLAMIGFVSAMAVELSSGQDVFAQISHGGVPAFVATSLVLSLASLVTLFKGVRAESKSSGLMTSDAELWNGRAAMLGLVALAFTEYVTGSALI